MNIYPSGPENSGQTSIRNDNLAPNVVRVRSYKCTFCKRKFSNAQALGGHMNIHRKDRAKLREYFSHENLLSLGIAKSTTDRGDEKGGIVFPNFKESLVRHRFAEASSIDDEVDLELRLGHGAHGAKTLNH